MALLLTLATGAWAQDPDPIDLTPSADGTVWTLSTMPEYDVEKSRKSVSFRSAYRPQNMTKSERKSLKRTE